MPVRLPCLGTREYRHLRGHNDLRLGPFETKYYNLVPKLCALLGESVLSSRRLTMSQSIARWMLHTDHRPPVS
ncbi:hypothetical protein Forpe1208_v010752 [Fusarium oxysporum f. sp. rapae]|uniref:Uncharacterized protein n=1 Tax=Fusarium oxysporum f. sp. rapae TaxID=485398 RepID=A0A8J5NWQ8_FUSOX|nr:hypothetical protein Forpe1208_v010752 [Fusarium oxysporum f. sp. rapae]